MRFEHMRRHVSKGGLGCYNYTQAPLAAAFATGANGMEADARAEPARYVERFEPRPAARQRLENLVTEAIEAAPRG
jgi:hypothetical protein